MDAQEKALLDGGFDEETELRSEIVRFVAEQEDRLGKFRESMNYQIAKIKEDRVMDALVSLSQRLTKIEEKLAERDEDGDGRDDL